jgi:hypothetical protein
MTATFRSAPKRRPTLSRMRQAASSLSVLGIRCRSLVGRNRYPSSRSSLATSQVSRSSFFGGRNFGPIHEPFAASRAAIARGSPAGLPDVEQREPRRPPTIEAYPAIRGLDPHQVAILGWTGAAASPAVPKCAQPDGPDTQPGAPGLRHGARALRRRGSGAAPAGQRLASRTRCRTYVRALAAETAAALDAALAPVAQGHGWSSFEFVAPLERLGP